jgi:hypothetical protein
MASLPSTFYRALSKYCRVSPNTRQRKVIVTAPGNDDGANAECPQSDNRQRSSPRAPLPGPLPSVLGGTR